MHKNYQLSSFARALAQNPISKVCGKGDEERRNPKSSLKTTLTSYYTHTSTSRSHLNMLDRN